MIRVLDDHVQDEDAPERRAADAAVELDAARAELAEAERQQRERRARAVQVSEQRAVSAVAAAAGVIGLVRGLLHRVDVQLEVGGEVLLVGKVRDLGTLLRLRLRLRIRVVAAARERAQRDGAAERDARASEQVSAGEFVLHCLAPLVNCRDTRRWSPSTRGRISRQIVAITDDSSHRPIRPPDAPRARREVQGGSPPRSPRTISALPGLSSEDGPNPGRGEHVSDADLRVRVHEVREGVRGAHRSQLRRGSGEVSCLRRSRRGAPNLAPRVHPRRAERRGRAAGVRPRGLKLLAVARSGDPHLHSSRIPRTSERGDPAVHSRARAQNLPRDRLHPRVRSRSPRPRGDPHR